MLGQKSNMKLKLSQSSSSNMLLLPNNFPTINHFLYSSDQVLHQRNNDHYKDQVLNALKVSKNPDCFTSN